MTGNELLTEFDGIAANDLDPLATTTAAKLVLLNTAAKRVMYLLKLKVRSVPFTYSTGTTRYSLLTLTTPLCEVNRVRYLDVDYPRDDVEENDGWSQMDDYIDVFFEVANAGIVYLDGYQCSAPIVASGASITDMVCEPLIRKYSGCNSGNTMSSMVALPVELMAHCTSHITRT